TKKVEENLHVRFLEDKPIIAGTEESIGVGHSNKETRSSQDYILLPLKKDGSLFDSSLKMIAMMNHILLVMLERRMMKVGSSNDYILMPLWKDGSLFDSSSKNASNYEPQHSSDARKKNDDGVTKKSGINDQERPENSTQDVNTARPSINTVSTNVNTGSLNINIVSPSVTTAPLKATHADLFGDETKVDISNISTTYLVPSTPNTRIHKDHSLDHVISDVQSGVQTRRMTKTISEQGFISAVYERKIHKDLHTCLFACFLSPISRCRCNEEPIPNVVSSPHQKTQTPRQALNKITELPQTSEPIPNVADEVVYEEWDDIVEKAATTIASLDVEQASGAKKPWRVPLLRLGVHTPGSDEERFEQHKLTGRFDDETNFDGGFYKVQVTPTQVSAHGEAHSQKDQPEDQLGVLSAAKVLGDATRKNVQTYTRRRKAVSTVVVELVLLVGCLVLLVHQCQLVLEMYKPGYFSKPVTNRLVVNNRSNRFLQ
nr:hypothetical protein [Tanacetum cinerariifolium]